MYTCSLLLKPDDSDTLYHYHQVSVANSTYNTGSIYELIHVRTII